jgi:site-specific DNA recombinase
MPGRPASACVPRAARDCLRALAQRVKVDAQELRIMGSKSELLRTLVAA